MRLELFSFLREGDQPNLVCLQNSKLTALPTVLVCPLKESMAMTPLRVRFSLGGKDWVVACDLLRPIHRQGLRPMGYLDEKTSVEIVRTFLRILPSPFAEAGLRPGLRYERRGR
jgi:mRNA-degrading endonuclease toxin of MazEF toxin-antitoxin module